MFLKEIHICIQQGYIIFKVKANILIILQNSFNCFSLINALFELFINKKTWKTFHKSIKQ